MNRLKHRLSAISLSAWLLCGQAAPATAGETAAVTAAEAQKTHSEAKASAETQSTPSAFSKNVLLKGGVTESVSPLAADGSTNTVPPGSTVSLTMIANVNSEVSQVGDDVVAMVSLDMKDKSGKKIMLPGQWCVHGNVSAVGHQKRLGRDGYVTVHFDKLVSPDGKYQVPINADATTHESTAKAVTKVVAKDSYIVSKGAFAGALTSVQFTGIPLAVATHGYSVAAGAAVGATIGLVAALRRKGKIQCGLPGEELAFHFDKPVTLPAFNAEALPSAIPHTKPEDLDIFVQTHKFVADPFEDKGSRLLRVTFRVMNNSEHEYSFRHFVVVSDHNKMYYPYALSVDSNSQRQKTVAPNSYGEGTLTFGVDTPKRKYWLVLLDRADREELARVPVN